LVVADVGEVDHAVPGTVRAVDEAVGAADVSEGIGLGEQGSGDGEEV
jgi:hypothetical protein